MPVFVVVATRVPREVKAAIDALNAPSYEIKDDTWLVDYEGTTRELAERIGIRPIDSPSSGVVFPITNFSGKHRSDLWEWLKLHVPRDGA